MLRRSFHSLLAMTGDSLLSRNDSGNFRILCDEILGSSPRMTKNASRDDTRLGNSRIPSDFCLGILDFRILDYISFAQSSSKAW